jgi:deazaflavin-dependent oxidoreductase (nitroreductase family)
VLVTMRGAKTGKLREIPVMRVEHDRSYAVVGSKGASQQDPAWYHNLKAHPEVSLQDGTQTKQYVAREVEGDERAEWWERAVAGGDRHGGSLRGEPSRDGRRRTCSHERLVRRAPPHLSCRSPSKSSIPLLAATRRHRLTWG